MSDVIYIRPLCESDAEVSWRWRNDVEVWRYTGGRPDRVITPQLEHDWIQRALTDATCKRFAICLSETNQYIGNVQLSDIDTNAGTAEFHIFIGERSAWGRGYGTLATRLMLKYAKEMMGLRTIFLFVNEANTAAVHVYQKLGFVFLDMFEQKPNGRMRKMQLDLATFSTDSPFSADTPSHVHFEKGAKKETDMSRPIGGYHPFELSTCGELPYVSHQDGAAEGAFCAFPINLGRSGLSFILQHRRYRKVWLPAYICPVVFDTLDQLGVAYETYMLDMQLAPVGHFDTLADDEAFLYVDYFGLKDATVRRLAMERKNFIADLTMAFFCRPPATVDSFNSARKFVGVPDGGFLFGTVAETLNQQIQKDPDSVPRQTGWPFCQHLLMRADGDVESGYPYFRENSEAMDHWSPCRMSLLSEKILRSVAWRTVAQRRRENFLWLHEHFGKMNELNWDSVAEAMSTSDTYVDANPMPPSDVPQCYPLLLTDRNVGEDWKKRLIADKIFVPTFWPKSDRYLVDFPWEQCLVRNLVCFPIDQNCTLDDMRRIIVRMQNG